MIQFIPSSFKYFLLVALMGVISGCETVNSKVGTYFELDTDLQIDFIVDSDLNPDESGNASPLFVRMYELKNQTLISKADFIDLYEDDKKVLGADFVTKHDLKRFKPGVNRTEHFVLDKKAHHVALFAEFLDYKDSKYKLVFPVIANNVFRNKVIIRITSNELVLQE